MFFWQVWGCKYPAFTVENPVLPSVFNSQIHKIIFPCSFRACNKTPRTQFSIPWEKKSGKSVLWVCVPYLLLPWLSESILSDGLQAREWQAVCFFQKTQIFDQTCCLFERQMNQRLFLAGLRLQLSRFHTGKKVFDIRTQLPCHRIMFPYSFRAL